MTERPDRPLARWIHAAKPASWPKLLVPALLGQGIGVAATGALSWTGLAAGLAFTVLDLLFVVFLNDVGDLEVDRIKRSMFPRDCSPKTLPDGILGVRTLVTAGVAAGLLAVALAWACEAWLDRPGLGLAATACLLLFVGYTFPPVQLNCRGGGELLEMAGVGLALPWLNAYLQSGQPLPSGLWLLPGFALLSLASAVASGLADEQSDRRGGKITYVGMRGNAAARKTVESLVLLAMLAWAASARGLPGLLPVWVAVPTIALLAIHWRRLVAASPGAGTNAFAGQRHYKAQLHGAIWRSTFVLAVLLVARAILASEGGGDSGPASSSHASPADPEVLGRGKHVPIVGPDLGQAVRTRRHEMDRVAGTHEHLLAEPMKFGLDRREDLRRDRHQPPHSILDVLQEQLL